MGKPFRQQGNTGFVSCSDEAVENGIVTLEDYPIVDYILGLEKEDPIAKAYYKTFSSPMQRLITSYCQSGGHLFVSGAYVGSDMSGTQREPGVYRESFEIRLSEQSDRQKFRSNQWIRTQHHDPRLPNETSYAVTAPDCIVPVAPAFPVFTYARGNQSAGIAYKGADYRTFVLGFPFESIQSETDRASIMAGILGFFTQK